MAGGLIFCLLAELAYGADPQDEDPVRIYSTRSEQREAGLQHQLTPWLTGGGLAELEWNYDRIGYSNTSSTRAGTDTSASVQMHATATPWDFLTGELILDYDTDSDRIGVDEAILGLERRGWEIAYGRQYLPFGVYFSHFANGPLLEFGETRDVAATLGYDHKDRIDLTFGLYQGQGRSSTGSSRGIDWTWAAEVWVNESLSFGLSYLSDLADAGGDLLGDTGHRYSRRVPALSGYLVWTSDHLEITAEIVGATRAFRELDNDRDQPLAWNIEFANFLHPVFDWALRLEGTHDLDEAPELRYGVAVSFRAGRYGSLTLDYLRSHYRHNYVSTDAGDFPADGDTFSAQLSVAF